MAPSRKSRSVKKKLSNIHEAASSRDKDAANVVKTRQKASAGVQKVFLTYLERSYFHTSIKIME